MLTRKSDETYIADNHIAEANKIKSINLRLLAESEKYVE